MIPLLTYTFGTYIQDNYITLLLLSALIIMLIGNRKMKISGTNYVWLIIGITLAITVLQAVELMCDRYGWSHMILYYKCAATYWLYPLAAMLELYLVAPIKHKFLMAIPYAVNFILVFTDIFDTRIIYYYGVGHEYQVGPLTVIPAAATLFYVIALGVYSIRILGKNERSKGIIVLFITLSTIITVIGEKNNFLKDHTETVIALNMLVYYFFLAAINHSETQKKLYESLIELEQDRTKLLMAQIQPHFIYNSLTAIRAYLDEPDRAEAAINHFSGFLRGSIDLLNEENCITAGRELKTVRDYLYMEKERFGKSLDVVYDLRDEDFFIPAFSVQVLAENAVNHGIRESKTGKGSVTVRSFATDTEHIIEVEDDGKGFTFEEPKDDDRSHIGLSNLRKRLEMMCGGKLEIISEPDKGTLARIKIPKAPELSAEGESVPEVPDDAQRNYTRGRKRLAVNKKLYKEENAMRILIVDDEESALHDISRMLKKVVPDAHIETADEAEKALELFRECEFDVAFLDIKMPVKDGLTIAKEMKQYRPLINVIMVTGFPQYALDAVRLYVSDYIVKPVLPEDLSRALANLRYPVSEIYKGLYVRCLGSFEVFFDGEPVHFGRAKVKEFFAYLIDRRGSTATNAEIRAVLWQDEATDDVKQRKYLAQLAYELRQKLEEYGAADIFIQSRDSYAVDAKKIRCDYYTALKRNEISEYRGEYMSQYSWAVLNQ